MSESPPPTTSLGKRERDGAEDEQMGNEGPSMEESDDDIGPMPMPAEGAAKKKRKGVQYYETRITFCLLCVLQCFRTSGFSLSTSPQPTGTRRASCIETR